MIEISPQKPSLFNWQSGDWKGLDAVREALDSIRGHQHAVVFHNYVVDALQELGWKVAREHPVTYNGGCAGRVDVIAYLSGRIIALELDNRTARGRSILKLQSFGRHVACAVLVRNPVEVFK